MKNCIVAHVWLVILFLVNVVVKMECDKRKQPTCNIIYEGLTPEDYYTTGNIDELGEALREYSWGTGDDVYENYGIE